MSPISVRIPTSRFPELQRATALGTGELDILSNRSSTAGEIADVLLTAFDRQCMEQLNDHLQRTWDRYGYFPVDDPVRQLLARQGLRVNVDSDRTVRLGVQTVRTEPSDPLRVAEIRRTLNGFIPDDLLDLIARYDDEQIVFSSDNWRAVKAALSSGDCAIKSRIIRASIAGHSKDYLNQMFLELYRDTPGPYPLDFAGTDLSGLDLTGFMTLCACVPAFEMDWRVSQFAILRSSLDVELIVQTDSEVSTLNINLRGAKLNGCDLHGMALQMANLEGADLTGADMHRTQLNNAILRDANLTGARMSNAMGFRTKFAGADLSGADLRYMYLQDADFTGARLVGADLRNTVLVGANFTGADLTGARLSG